MYFEASSNGASIFADKIHDYLHSNTDLTVFINLATPNKIIKITAVNWFKEPKNTRGVKKPIITSRTRAGRTYDAI